MYEMKCDKEWHEGMNNERNENGQNDRMGEISRKQNSMNGEEKEGGMNIGKIQEMK